MRNKELTTNPANGTNLILCLDLFVWFGVKFLGKNEERGRRAARL
jgi:hypothetical protein